MSDTSVIESIDVARLPRDVREQLLQELGRGNGQSTPVNLRLRNAKYDWWREAAEKESKSFAAFAEAALDEAAARVVGRPTGLSYLPSEERRALITRLTAWGRYCLLFPPEKVRAWQRAAKRRDLRMQQLVEDALDAAVATPPPHVKDSAPRTAALGLSLPETKLVLWHETANAADRSFTEWCEAAIDRFTAK